MTVTPHVRSGFSFIELMVVLMIIAILAAVGVPAIMNWVDKARVTTTKSNLQSTKTAITVFKNEIGKYPAKLRDLVEKPKEPALSRNWQKGGYIEGGELLKDAWGEDFVYKRTPEGKNQYELYSYGPEGAGAPKEEWISVWDK